MLIKNHIRIFIIAILAWLAFYIGGIPTNYYTAMNSAELTNFFLTGGFAVLPAVTLLIMLLIKEDSIKLGWWLAFYTSLPLFILDYILVGVIEGEGLSFLKTHLALSVGYLEVWIIGPLTGWALKRFQKRVGQAVIIERGEV